MASKRKNKREEEVSAAERAAYTDQLLDDALGEGLGSGEADDAAEYDGDELDDAPQGPMQGHKVWMILAGILVVIAVAVLYVYQAGDKKTVLGNQPIPAGPGPGAAAPGFSAGPLVGGTLNVPVGGNAIGQAFGGAGPLTAAATTVGPVGGGGILTCPHCATQGLPVCGSCGSVMKSLGDGSGLFACPSCGTVGVPLCPGCGGRMSGAGGGGRGAQPVAQAGPISGGQFQCPSCGATGLPNWDPSGAPICPNCSSRMQVRPSSGPPAGVVP